MRNINLNFTLFQNAIHDRHRVQIELRGADMQLDKFLFRRRGSHGERALVALIHYHHQILAGTEGKCRFRH